MRSRSLIPAFERSDPCGQFVELDNAAERPDSLQKRRSLTGREFTSSNRRQHRAASISQRTIDRQRDGLGMFRRTQRRNCSLQQQAGSANVAISRGLDQLRENVRQMLGNRGTQRRNLPGASRSTPRIAALTWPPTAALSMFSHCKTLVFSMAPKGTFLSAVAALRTDNEPTTSRHRADTSDKTPSRRHDNPL
jgi:hypothetical protein